MLFDNQIQGVLNREHEIAKQHLANGQKDRALVALRQRKYQESLLVKTDTQLEQLEQLVRPFPSPSWPTTDLGSCTGLNHRVLPRGDVGVTWTQDGE